MACNLGIGFVTGRKNFQSILKTYVNNWLEHGITQDSNIRLHLFIAYDLKYFNTKSSDYKNIPHDVARLIDSIHFYGATEVAEETARLKTEGAISDEEAERLFGDGYAKKRNIVTYFAIKNRMDKLLFLDDDEYPVATLKNEDGSSYWMGQSIVGTHLKYNDEVNITHGHHCGYISPIPYIKFDDVLTEQVFGQFIEAISNDIVSWEKLKNLIHQHQCVTYADAKVINATKAVEVLEENGMKFISGANLCFNLKKTKNLPPFYNPPGARGEDTFMSTMLSDLKVAKVPCYTFHDGFLTYKNLLHGVIPRWLEGVDGNIPSNQKRFINATIGWIRYKPLLIYLTKREEYPAIMEEIRVNLHESLPKLNAFFNTRDFDKVLVEFEFYTRHVLKHFEDFEKTKKAWRKLLNTCGA